MKLTRIIAVGIIVASAGISGLHAQSLRDSSPPQEFPPASYQGKQYVDSRGCIYIRAGIDGNVTWVPRVSRDRKQVCGFKPTNVGTAVATAAPKAKAPVQITLPQTAAAPAAAPARPATPTRAPARTVATTPTTAPARVAPAPVSPAGNLSTVAASSTAPRSQPAQVAAPSPGPKPTVFSPARVTSKNPTGAVAKPATAPAPVNTAAPVRTATAPLPSVRAPSPAPRPTLYAPGLVTGETAKTSAPASSMSVLAPGRIVTTSPRVATTAPRIVTTAPPPTTYASPRTVTTTTTSPAPASAAPRTSACSNASAHSQQYINSGSRYQVRCGPQTQSPVTIRNRESSSLYGTAQTGVAVASSTDRVVPRHVYDNRQNTTNVIIPEGYRAAWEDDRLNPRRAERTLAPANVQERTTIPPGYRVAWDDGRLNRNRGMPTAAGNAESAQIWTNTVPRRLKKVPTQGRVVTLSSRNNPASAPAPTQTQDRPVTRVSTRSAPSSKPSVSPVQYVRVETYASDSDARTTAKWFAAQGLPMRLGTVQRGGKSYRVVLAGPFDSRPLADAALSKVRSAGFGKASLSN